MTDEVPAFLSGCVWEELSPGDRMVLAAESKHVPRARLKVVHSGRLFAIPLQILLSLCR